jgi:hypothetical protein
VRPAKQVRQDLKGFKEILDLKGTQGPKGSKEILDLKEI